MKEMDIKEQAKVLEPTVRIGRQGLANPIIEEIKKQIKKRGMIKVKMLRSFIGGRNKKELASLVASEANADLIGMIGFVLVLKRKS